MLSSIDKKILSNIMENSRMTIKELSSNVKVSRDTISKYVKKLEAQGIIFHHTLKLNLSKFSIASYTLLLKFSKYDQAKVEELIVYIKELNYTHMIGQIGGEFDLYVGFSVKETKELENFIDSIYSRFPNFVKKHSVYTDVKHYKSDISCILTGKVKKDLKFRDEKKMTKSLNEVDKEIISELTLNSRMSFAKIAYKLNMTTASILYRIRELEKKNVILGFRSMVNVTKLDKQLYYVFFNINQNDQILRKLAIEHLINHSKVVYFIKMVGNHSYQCLIHAKDNIEFHEILNELKANIDGLEDINISLKLDLAYHNYLPNGFLDSFGGDVPVS